MTRQHAVIVGTGIAGPVVAMWLDRIGFRVTLVEARPSPALAEGAFLGVAPNGMNALAALGLAERVLDKGYGCHGFEFLNGRGGRIGQIDRGRDRETFGWPLTMIRRGDLHALLAEGCRERGIVPAYGRKLSSLTTTGQGVCAQFEDGAEVEGDLLLGCDGVRSATRAVSLPDAPAPAFTGLLDFGGFVRTRDALPFPPGVNGMVFGRRAFFGAFTTPDGETWWFHNGPPNDRDLDAEGHRARLIELHRDDPDWIRRLIASTPRLLGPWRIHELRAMPRWSAGRVCLVGDAAHAMSPSAGQGASLAMEDAVVLAQCLRDIGDIPRAFAAFEALRRPRVDAIFESARRNSSSKAPSRLGAWLRDRMMPLFMGIAGKAQTRSYAWKPDFERRVADDAART